MRKEEWRDSVIARIENLERFQEVHESMEDRDRRDGLASAKYRQWAWNTALTAINTLFVIVDFWLTRK